MALHEQHQGRPTQPELLQGSVRDCPLRYPPNQKNTKTKCMPNDTSIAHTRQPSTQTMCHSRPRNQLNTFLKHEEKGSHDPPRKSHGYLESRRGMNCLHRFNLLRRPPQILHLATRPIRQTPRPSAMHRRSRRRSTSDTIHGRSPCIKQCSHAATNPMRRQLLSRRRMFFPTFC